MSDAARVPIIAASAAMRATLDAVARAAATETTVLLLGESGTGKEVLAKEIHARSRRAAGPFIAINCGTLTSSLIAAELFGHVRGAFTGALADKDGLFVAANGGTLFLDEIGDLPAELQVALLRVLQERRVRRVGDTRERPIDVRVVAATHRDLARLVREERFRADLLYRLQIVSIAVPPLRERAADVPGLVRSRLAELGARDQRTIEVTDGALALLASAPWPGNVRELHNLVERIVVLSPDARIDEAAIRRYGGVTLALPDAVPAGRAGEATTTRAAVQTRPAATGPTPVLTRWAVRWWRFRRQVADDGRLVYERPLSGIDRPEQTTPLRVETQAARLGRSGAFTTASGDIALEGEEVSRHHATFTTDDGALFLEDAGSTNGTFVDGRRLAPGVRSSLRSGAVLRVGKEWLGILLDADGDPPPAPSVRSDRSAIDLMTFERLWLEAAASHLPPSALDAAAITTALKNASGNKREAAKLLHISPTSLYQRMAQLGLRAGPPATKTRATTKGS